MGTVNDPCLREIRFKIMINIMNCTIVTNEFCPIFHNFLQFSSIERLLTAEIRTNLCMKNRLDIERDMEEKKSSNGETASDDRVSIESGE